MIDPLTFTSPLPVPDCIQRLEKLAEKKHFHFSAGIFIVHVNIDSIEVGKDSFNLFVCCSPHRFRLPAPVFLKLIGKIHPVENETSLRLWLQLHKPFSGTDWGLLAFWGILSFLALMGGVVGMLSSAPPRSLFIGLVFLVAGIGYARMFYQTYQHGMKIIPNLVYNALQQNSSAKSQGQDAKLPAWVSSLSEIQ